jgi:hypothetical protein
VEKLRDLSKLKRHLHAREIVLNREFCEQTITVLADRDELFENHHMLYGAKMPYTSRSHTCLQYQVNCLRLPMFLGQLRQRNP